MDVVEVENEAEAAEVHQEDTIPEDDSEGVAAKGPDEGSDHSSGNHELLPSAGVQEENTEYQLSLKQKYHLTHEFPVVVIDNGSTNIRAGLCGEERPNVVYPSIPGATYGASGILLDHQSSAIKNGVIQDWEAMEELWRHGFHKLGVASEDEAWKLDCGVMMCGGFAPQSTHAQKILETLFEKFDVPYACLQYREILALYATDRTTGVVLRSGGSSSTVMPVYKGFPIRNGTGVSPRAGRLVTKRLMEDLGSKDFTATQKAKEQFCQLLENPDAVNSRRKYSFKTVDGASYTLTGEEYTSPEVLFRLISPEEGQEMEQYLLHQLLYDCIQACSIDIRRELYTNIVITGGNSLIKGFAKRLKTEMTSLVPPAAKVDVITSDDQANMSWYGGSVISDMSTFKEDSCISKATFLEEGPKAITRLLGEAQF